MHERSGPSPDEVTDAAGATQPVEPSCAPEEAVSLPRAIVQAKLAVGPADDPYEREADRVADRVVRRLGASGEAPSSGSGDTRRANGGPPASRVRRVQRADRGANASSEIGVEGGALDAGTEDSIRSAASSGGRPLDGGTRSSMESAFGADFSGVRVHTGGQARELSSRIQAKAFTTGSDIFFRDGEPDTSTTSGQHLLAHELTHTIQQGGAATVQQGGAATVQQGGAAQRSVQRLWGFGNTGRTKGDEETVLEQASSGPAAIADRIKPLLKRTTFGSELTRFNKVMQLVTTPRIGDVNKAFGNDPTLQKAVTDSFTSKPWRATYLKHVIASGGRPSTEFRILLALGLAGGGSKSMVADQEEATRLLQGMRPQDQVRFFEKNESDLRAGSSSKGFKMIEGIVSAARGQVKLADNAPAPAQGQGHGQGGVQPPGGAASTAELKTGALMLLDGFDRELGAIVSRGLKAESTTVFDALTVRMSADVAQMADEVKGWVKRAKAVEDAQFGGFPVIRRYVSGHGFDVPLSDGSKFAVVKANRYFVEKLDERKFKKGWNPGDRLYIKGLVLGGAQRDRAEAKVAAGGQAGTSAVMAPDPDRSAYATAKLAITRAKSPKVIAALSALAGELAIVDDYGARNRRSRLREELMAIPPDQSWEFVAVLVGKPIPGDDDDLMADPAAKEALRADVNKVHNILAAAKLKPKHRAQFAAKLFHGKSATGGYIELRRYAFKKSFKTGKFLRRVSALTSSEREMARADVKLEQQVGRKMSKKPDELAQVKAMIGWGVAAPVAGPQTEDAARTAAQQDWADRWAMLITGSKDHKKMFNFALQIMNAADSVGGDAYLREVHALMPEAARKKLSKTSLGKALSDDSSTIGDDFDVVSAVIGKSKTARPTAAANVEAICQSFESLSGKMLLTEWTNFAELRTRLAGRNNLLARVTAIWEQLDPEDDAEMTVFQGMLAEVQAENDRLAGQLVLTFREDRRQQLNSGVSQLSTAEYQVVKDRHAEHLSAVIAGDDGARQALAAAGIMPGELDVVGSNILFLADQTKQSNLDTWSQWSAFTVRGQLRQESAGLLTGGLHAITDTARSGGDITTAAEDFAAQRAELKSRTKAFVDTANTYKERLKQIISMILTVIITISTAGIGGVGVLAMTAINAACEIVKQILMNGLDQVLAPGQSGFAGEMIIGSIKTLLTSALTIGIAALTNTLKGAFNLVDGKGLTAGEYLVNGSHHTSTAMQVGTKLSDSSWEGWATNLGMKAITTATTKAGGKAVDLVTDSLVHGPNGALKRLRESFKWSEILDLTVGVAFKDFVGRLQGEMLQNTSAGGTKKTSDIPDPNDPSKTIEVTHMQTNSVAGQNNLLDGQYTNTWDTSNTVGGKMTKATAKVATDQTVIRIINTAYSAPVSELEETLSNRRDTGGSGAPSLDGDPRQFQAALGHLLDSVNSFLADGSVANATVVRDALTALMADPAQIDALVQYTTREQSVEPTAARQAVAKWAIDWLSHVNGVIAAPVPAGVGA